MDGFGRGYLLWKMLLSVVSDIVFEGKLIQNY